MIEIQNLVKRYGSKVAVDHLSLEVPSGELFCFLGPNGAGKTTTIKCMTGLLRPTEGSIRLKGIDVASDPMAARKITGYIPDMPFLYERLTCIEFFEFIGNLYGIPQNVIRDELDPSFSLFGLIEHRNSLVKDLSHGLRQRLIYAATFLHKPEVLFVDEPLIGLDPFTIRLIKDLLREKVRNGMTIFMTTHILALAESVADRIGIISNGRLVAVGTMDDLRSHARMEGTLEDVFLKLTHPEHADGPEELNA